MKKILFCGNGINMHFDNNFAFSKFLDILKDSENLKREIEFVLSKSEYTEWKEFENEFIKISEQCKFSIENLNKETELVGVETAFVNFQEEIFDSIQHLKRNIDNKNYYKFITFFNILFFNYINSLELNFSEEKTNRANKEFKNEFLKKLKEYKFIYTLNYDTLLETIFNEEYITHIHGKIIKQKDEKIDFSNCKLDNYDAPNAKKTDQTTEPMFLNYKRLERRKNLDIIGISPINDENYFRFFILTKICNKITFYYHTFIDLQNFDKIIKNLNNYQINILDEKIEIQKRNFSFEEKIRQRNNALEKRRIGYHLYNLPEEIKYHYDSNLQQYTIEIINPNISQKNEPYILTINCRPSSEFWEYDKKLIKNLKSDNSIFEILTGENHGK